MARMVFLRHRPRNHEPVRHSGRGKWPTDYTMHVFVTPKRGAPLEDLGQIPVRPKPERGHLVRFQYNGEPAYGMVALIDPFNWEKRPNLIATIHVHMSGEE